MTSRPTGATACARTLTAIGIDAVFSVSGDQILSLYEAFDRQGIRIIHARHETAAVYMAEAWAQLRGSPALCLVTAGPGHLSALTGLAAATASETPVVLLAGSSPIRAAGTGAFQEVDQVAAAVPVCKAAMTAESPEAVGPTLRRAFEVAVSGVPGSVSMTIPVDVLEAPVFLFNELGKPATFLTGSEVSPYPESGSSGDATNTASAALEIIASARAPVVIVRPSLGRSRVFEQLAMATAGLPLFVAESPRGRGDPLLGSRCHALDTADLIVVVGPPDFAAVSPGDLLSAGKQPQAPRVLLVTSRTADIAQARRRERLGELDIAGVVLTDEQAFLSVLARQICQDSPSTSPARPAPPRIEAVAEATAHASDVDPKSRTELHPLEIVEAVRPWLGPSDILVVDGGEFGQWVRAGLRDLPNRQVFNGKLGAIGSAIPQAVGAAVAQRAGGRIWAFCGDGAFGYYSAEIDTAAREHIGIRIIIGNDSRWSAEWHHQVERYGADRAVATNLAWRHLEQVACGYGARGWCVDSSQSMYAALAEMLEVPLDIPTCLNVRMASCPSRNAG